ncbi:unnamed protein product [Paramecium sonneborni]|uniref:Uncharacterized protein n=1 Tax=Paramecium sonneborni TaxID=65129 RepID=A0A8S1QKG0_9CILI|nr:unnamed protein product [Paramecium sonneborni]
MIELVLNCNLLKKKERKLNLEKFDYENQIDIQLEKEHEVKALGYFLKEGVNMIYNIYVFLFGKIESKVFKKLKIQKSSKDIKIIKFNN